jgi:putative oxidoreductase
MTKPNLFTKWQAFAPYLQSILRIVASLMFMMAGAMKLFAFPAGMPPNGDTVTLMSQLGLAGVLEVFGGGLLLFGLFTRPVAFLLAGEMAIAYFQVHFPMSPWPTINSGVGPVLYCFIWLYFSAAGAGPWSLDAKWRK